MRHGVWKGLGGGGWSEVASDPSVSRAGLEEVPGGKTPAGNLKILIIWNQHLKGLKNEVVKFNRIF